MERIFPVLPAAVHDGGNRQARFDLMIGSLLAGVAFSHADVAAVHCMAEALGGLYDTPHGVANSMFMPVVTAFNAEAEPARHARAAAACGLPVANLGPESAAALLVESLAEMAESINIPQFSSLSYVKKEDFLRLAEAAAENGSTPSNCRLIGKEDYLRLFKEGYAAR